MKNSQDIFAIEIDKIDLEIALLFIKAFSNNNKILLHIGLMERIFELIQTIPGKDSTATKETETRRLLEIINNAIMHCTILSHNPRSYNQDPDSGLTIPGEIISDEETVSKASDVLPLLQELNERILTTLKNK